MIQEREWAFHGGSLYYQVKEDGVYITRFQGMATEVTIPEELDGVAVRTIEKKAFLSKKRLRRVCLPEGIETVGDWAFAYCDDLREVRLPAKKIGFGKAVFKECGKLEKICCYPMPKDTCCEEYIPEAAESNPEAVAELLAAAVTVFDADYLLDTAEAGTKEWLEKWDAKLKTMLDAPETEGYSKQVLCGEEDYGSTDPEAYTGNRRKERVRMALLRLLHPTGCTEDLKSRLEQYLLNLTKGCAHEETWLVIWKEHGNDKEYYHLFADLGCITKENQNGILADIGEDYPEMKSFFMGLGQNGDNFQEFFDGLEL